MTDKSNKNWIPESLKYIFKIINSPQLYLFIMVLLLIILAIISVRMPQKDLLQFAKLFINKTSFIVIFIFIEGFTIHMWQKQVKNLKSEIKRLTEDRKKYMHSLKEREKHYSSGIEL